MGFIRDVLVVTVPTLAGVVLLLEAVLRMAGYVPWYTDGSAYVPSANPGIIYELRPGFSGLYAGAPITINSLGFRGRELAGDHPGFRAVLVGDSVAFGQGIRDDETLAEDIAARLRRKRGTAVDVVNLGVPGYNTCQEYEHFKERALALKPQAAIVMYVDNDTEPPPFTVKGGTVISPDVRTGVWGDFAAAMRKSSAAYNFVWTNYQLVKAPAFTIDQYRELHSRRFDPANAAWRRSRSCLASMISLARSESIPVLVVPFPVLLGLGADPYPFQGYIEAVCNAARTDGAACLDVVPALRDADFALTVSRTERHPSASTEARIADAIVAILQ